MSSVSIYLTPPGGAEADITGDCLFSECTFTSQMNGAPGQFDIKVRDFNRTYSFVTGSEIRLVVDGYSLFGGYVLTIGMTSFAPAADTHDLSEYELRVWHLTGPDYNIAFDKRVIRNTGDYLSYIVINSAADDVILQSLVYDYTDMGDFDPSYISHIGTWPDTDHETIQQGNPVRQEFERMLGFWGAVYYIDGDKHIVWESYDSASLPWGFSDAPDNVTTFGFSEFEMTEDATQMANDVMVWGGSELVGHTVFARYQDAVANETTLPLTGPPYFSYFQDGAVTPGSSIATHGRWQHAETHFGEQGYKLLSGVQAGAQAVLDGPPGTGGSEKGLKYPQWSCTFAWHSSRTPSTKVRAGNIVSIELTTFGITKSLPIRTLVVSFPDALDSSVYDREVRFEGTFGLQLSDNYTLWRYLIQQETQARLRKVPVTAVTNASTQTVYGANYLGEPTPSPNGSTTVFTTKFGYIPGTLIVAVDGKIKRPGIDYTETDFEAGTFTLSAAPATGVPIVCTCLTQAS